MQIHADLARLLVTDYQHVLFVFFLCHLKNVLMGYLPQEPAPMTAILCNRFIILLGLFGIEGVLRSVAVSYTHLFLPFCHPFPSMDE